MKNPDNVLIESVIPGKPQLVGHLKEAGITTLATALRVGKSKLLSFRGLGPITLEEIEIAALNHGRSFNTKNRKIIFLTNHLVQRYGMTNTFYKVGHPLANRGEISPGDAFKFADIVRREGGSLKL